MDFEKLNDLKISDDFDGHGGDYRDIRINGDADINGDTNCRSFTISGDADISGSINCEMDMKVNGDGTFKSAIIRCGTLKVAGDIDCNGDIDIKGSFTVYGDADFEGNTACERIKVMGDIDQQGNMNVIDTVEIMGDAAFSEGIKAGDIKIYGDIEKSRYVKGKNISIYGDLCVQGDVEGEKIAVKGDTDCDGLINGEEIYLDAYNDHRVKEIGGKIIRITVGGEKGLKLFSMFSGSKYGKGLRCKCIEGDDIELWNTKADMVRGKRVVICNECVIEKVEYSGVLIIEGNGIVKESIRI